MNRKKYEFQERGAGHIHEKLWPQLDEIEKQKELAEQFAVNGDSEKGASKKGDLKKGDLTWYRVSIFFVEIVLFVIVNIDLDQL